MNKIDLKGHVMRYLNMIINLFAKSYKPSNEELLRAINREYAAKDWADYA